MAQQLNTKKTEVLWFGSAANLRKVTLADRCLTIRPDVEPVEVVRDLGVLFDTHLTMNLRHTSPECREPASTTFGACVPFDVVSAVK